MITRSLARIALAMLLAGCDSLPDRSGDVSTPEATKATASPTLAVEASPTMTAEASPGGPEITVSWEPSRQLKEAVAGGAVFGMRYGPNGWVAIGECAGGIDCATAWFSKQGRTWSQHLLPDKAQILQLAAGADGYVASGIEPYRQDRNEHWARYWFSPDGKQWDRLGRLRLGSTSAETWGLALAPSGAILVGYVRDHPAAPTGPYISRDGEVWNLVDLGALGVEALSVGLIQSTPTEVILVGNPCPAQDGTEITHFSCDPRVWTSTDGETWVDRGAIGQPDDAPPGPDRQFGVTSIVKDGDRMVATVEGCDDIQTCNESYAQIWSSVGDGPWTLRAERPYLTDTQVVFTGTTFLMLSNDDYEVGPVLLASLDGATWWDVPDGSFPVLDPDDCSPWAAAGNETVFVGHYASTCMDPLRGTVNVGPSVAP